MFEGIRKKQTWSHAIEHLGRYSSEIGLGLLKIALTAGVLWSATAEAVHAWDDSIPVPQSHVERVFTEIGMPSITELSSSHVTYFNPSTNGKYIVQIRLEHKNPFSRENSEGVDSIIATQRDTYDTIQSIVDVNPYTVFYAEGIGKQSTEEIKKKKEFRNVAQELIVNHFSREEVSSVSDLLETISNSYRSKNGSGMYRSLVEEYASLVLDYTHQKNIPLSPIDADFLQSRLQHNYEAPMDA